MEAPQQLQEERPSLARALTIAGSDSGGGAGIQADLRTFAARGVFGTSVLTAVTAQNTLGVRGYRELEPDFVAEQLEAVLDDIGTDAAKTGMVASAGLIEAIVSTLDRRPVPHLVVDPVMIAASGDPLLAPDAREALARRLVARASLVTPNLAEAEVLAGMSIASEADVREAARRIADLGARAVLIKGGHLAERGLWPEEALDFLYIPGPGGGEWHVFQAPLIRTRHTHGTGCTYSAAITAELAKGLPLPEAVAVAKAYLTEAIRYGLAIGHGRGPTHHLVELYRAAGWPLGTSARPAVGKDMPVRHRRPTVDYSLYVITDRRLMGDDWLDDLEAAIMGGATIVQLREKGLETGEWIRLARQALQITRRYGVPLIINDRVDVALAVGADGVHVGQTDMPAELARRLVGPDRILGVSAGTPEEARAAEAAGADYLGVGSVYATGSKADAGLPIGPEGLARIASAVRVPVVGIGGISAANAGDVIAAGAVGVSVISAVFGAADVRAAARALRDRVAAARHGRASA